MVLWGVRELSRSWSGGDEICIVTLVGHAPGHTDMTGPGTRPRLRIAPGVVD
jgi:hypothetical protein